MTFRERCKQFLDEQTRNAIMRQGSPVDDLMAFVIAENGRAADLRLENSLPLCLYFLTKEDREEFVQVIRAAKPGMITKELP